MLKFRQDELSPDGGHILEALQADLTPRMLRERFSGFSDFSLVERSSLDQFLGEFLIELSFILTSLSVQVSRGCLAIFPDILYDLPSV